MKENSSAGFILVAGSAHLDILSTISGDPKAMDKIGKLSIHFGGTAYNVVINMAGFGHECRFLSGMKRSPFTNLILDNLKDSKVDPWVIQQDDLPLGGFSAHLWDGDMVSAVSSMPVEKVTFEPGFLDDAFNGAKAVVLECNLSTGQLNLLALKALKKGIPFFVAGVSEEKSMRLRSINETATIVFMNRKEADYVAGFDLESDDDYRRLSSILKSPLVVTLNKDGALAVTPDKVVTRVTAADLNRDKEGNFLGAGDALMSLVIHHHLSGNSLPDALRSAMTDFPAHAFNENCSLEETGLIEQRMTAVDHMAKYDGMTNLHNRRTGELLLDAEISRVQRQTENSFSIMLFDIDKFKSVNDTWGHDIGDQVIKGVARGFKDCIRPHDIGIRWGGEEFLCILPGANPKEGQMIAERLRAYVEATILEPRVITISIGVAAYKPGLTAKALVENADKALYYAKEHGRNQVVLAE